MDLTEIVVIFIFCIFQSVFGVGLLLLGTPTFLLFGYDFFEVLNILLPYSIVISLFQIVVSKKRNFLFGKKILIHSIPFLILGLIIIHLFKSKIDFILITSIILITFSILNIINLKRGKFKIKNVNFALKFLGLVHGLTNLGGTLLSLISANAQYNKNIIRYNISSGYFIFAVFQLLLVNLFFQKINFEYLKFIWLPIIICILSQIIFKKIDNITFYKMLNIFTLFYGFYIFIDAIYSNFFLF